MIFFNYWYLHTGPFENINLEATFHCGWAENEVKYQYLNTNMISNNGIVGQLTVIKRVRTVSMVHAKYKHDDDVNCRLVTCAFK